MAENENEMLMRVLCNRSSLYCDTLEGTDSLATYLTGGVLKPNACSGGCRKRKMPKYLTVEETSELKYQGKLGVIHRLSQKGGGRPLKTRERVGDGRD